MMKGDKEQKKTLSPLLAPNQDWVIGLNRGAGFIGTRCSAFHNARAGD
jgi:hypothetical protein